MSVEWIVIRGSGVVAFALLTAACVWGLLLSTKIVTRFTKAKALTWFHESLGLGALLATVVHVAVLSIHDFLPFSWAEILIPGAASWRPLATALGTVGLYGLLVVSLSFYFRRWIGQRAWRYLHFLAFGVFAAALLHGILAGTDRSLIMIGLYAGAAIAISALVVQRIVPGAIRANPQDSTNGPRTAAVSRGSSESE